MMIRTKEMSLVVGNFKIQKIKYYKRSSRSIFLENVCANHSWGFKIMLLANFQIQEQPGFFFLNRMFLKLRPFSKFSVIGPLSVCYGITSWT